MTFPDKSSSLGNPVDRLPGYSLLGCKESDKTKQLSFNASQFSYSPSYPPAFFFFFFFNFGHAARLAASPFPELGPWQ